MVVDRIGKTISANEAKEANLVLPWMAAFFAARFVTILTAAPAGCCSILRRTGEDQKSSFDGSLGGAHKVDLRHVVGRRTSG
jgi:hypothetical protein